MEQGSSFYSLAYLPLIRPFLGASCSVFVPSLLAFESLDPPVVLPDHLVDVRRDFLLDSKSSEDSKGSFQSLINQKR